MGAVYALAVLVFLVSTCTGRHGNVWFDGVLYDGLNLTAAALLLWRARSLSEPGPRRAWQSLGVGLALSACGDVVYTAYVGRQPGVPFPSVADAFYLAFYPCALAALVALIRTSMRTAGRITALDGALAALGLAAATSAMVMVPGLVQTHGPLTTQLVSLAYPLGDIALVGGSMLALVLQGRRTTLRRQMIALSYLGWGLGDAVYLFQAAHGTYREATPLDAVWPVAGLLVVCAAWTRRRPAVAAVKGTSSEAVPVFFSLVALLVLTWDHYVRLSGLAVILADVCLLFALLRLVIAFRDSQQLAASRALALTDELTGLANRRALLEALRAAPAGQALVLFDLDRFKEVNDSLGHRAGDDLLRQLATRLRRAKHPADLLARLGGDEFAMLLRVGVGQQAALTEVKQLLTQVAAPFRVDEVTLHVDASAGLSFTTGVAPDQPAADPTVPLQQADVAMYAAKRRAGPAGGSVVAYEPGLDPDGRDRLALVEALRNALEHGDELRCLFQPKVDLRTGKVAGVESLVRWQHPELGALMPERFLPAVERAGLMGRLTLAVLDLSLAQARAWVRQGTPIVVAVNLSASNLLDVALPDQVQRLLMRHGVPASLLRLEITEEVLMTEHARSLAVVDELAALGVRVSIDDYGTGYSSLGYLQRLPVDELKLDRSFIIEAASDPRTAVIVESTITLGRRLGMVVVAEGVEDQRTADLLSSWGCDLAQGFHYSPPLPACDLALWQRAWEASHAGVEAGRLTA